MGRETDFEVERRTFLQQVGAILGIDSLADPTKALGEGGDERYKELMVPLTYSAEREISQDHGTFEEEKTVSEIKIIDIGLIKYDTENEQFVHPDYEIHYQNIGENWIREGSISWEHPIGDPEPEKFPNKLFNIFHEHGYQPHDKEPSLEDLEKRNKKIRERISSQELEDMRGDYEILNYYENPEEISESKQFNESREIPDNEENCFGVFRSIQIHSNGGERDYSDWGEQGLYGEVQRHIQENPQLDDDMTPFQLISYDETEELLDDYEGEFMAKVTRQPDFRGIDSNWSSVYGDDGLYHGEKIQIYSNKEDSAVAEVKTDGFKYEDKFGLGAVKLFVKDLRDGNVQPSSADQEALTEFARATEPQEAQNLVVYENTR